MTIFRNGRRRIVATNGVVLALLVVWAVEATATARLLPLALAALVLVVSVYVLRRPRLSVSERGLTIANMLTTRRLPWRSISSFGYGEHGRAWCVQVEGVDGSITPVRVLSDDPRAGGYSTERVGKVVAQLRTKLEESSGVRDRGQVIDLGGGRTLDVGVLGGSDVALRRARRNLRWTQWSLVAAGVFFVGLGASTVRGAASRPQVYADLRRDGVRLDARFDGCGPPTRFSSARDTVCWLTVTYQGQARRWTYRDDYPQFDHLAIGARVPVLLDPMHPSTVYTAHDVATNDNSGIVSAIGFFGIGIIVAGLGILVFSVRLWRKVAAIRA